jgi:hypothetical protein
LRDILEAMSTNVQQYNQHFSTLEPLIIDISVHIRSPLKNLVNSTGFHGQKDFCWI